MENKGLKKQRAVNINFNNEEFKMIEAIAGTYGKSYSKILRTLVLPGLQDEYRKLKKFQTGEGIYDSFKAITEGNTNFLI
jgi:hypothetical protein